jgi:hypothetical protein
VDAFNKPFLVGGLKRSEDDKGASTSASASTSTSSSTSTIMRRTEIVTPALGEAGVGQDKSNGKGAGKGKERVAGVGEEAAEVEETGSPDWPDEQVEEDEHDEESATEQRRPKSPSPRDGGRVPSRSPGFSPGPRPPEGDGVAGDAAWRDPLDDDDDDDGEEDGRAAKRARM